MAPKLTLTYFPIAGRGEPVRLACALGKIAFTNKVVTFPEFSELKSSLPLGQLPIMDVEEEGRDKITIPQTIAMMRFVGKLGGLYPENPIESGKVDSIIDSIEDMMNPLSFTIQGPVRLLMADEGEFSPEEKKEMRLRILDKHFPKYLGRLEAIAKESSGYLVGDKPTIADVLFYTVYLNIKSGVVDHIPTDLIAAYPTLQSIVDKLAANPQVKGWYEKYSKPYSTFDYAP